MSKSEYSDKDHVVVVGIDPGLRGAIAARLCGVTIGLWDMPTEPRASKGNQVNGSALAGLHKTLLELIGNRRSLFVIERVHAMPRQGVSTMFRMGESFGIARFFCHLFPTAAIELVQPATWKREMRIPKKAKKLYSLTKARAMFSDARLMLARKKDEGRAEALLIAEYGRRFIL